jgi:predicted RNA-binding Zn ribbon-like protein
MVWTAVDDDVWRREQASPQPGQRPAAPGQLALLQAFLNSHFDLVENWGADQLGDPAAARSWLASRRLIARNARLSQDDVVRALTVRESLRRLVASSGGSSAGLERDPQGGLNQAIADATLGLRLTDAGLRLVPTGAAPLDRALGVLLSIALGAVLDGTWARLKTCPGDHCGWVFYDRSRNNSGRWCSMTVCGGREKARTHYHRQRTRAG